MKIKILKVIKSFIPLILVSSLSLVIISCDKTNYKTEKEDNKPTNKLGQITKATLTDREKGLVSSLGGINTYVFDVKLNKDTNSDWVDLWIDHYEKGILKEPSQFISSGLTIGEKKTLNSTFIFSDEEELKKDIAETEHFYILRCKFSNKPHEK